MGSNILNSSYSHAQAPLVDFSLNTGSGYHSAAMNSNVRAGGPGPDQRAMRVGRGMPTMYNAMSAGPHGGMTMDGFGPTFDLSSGYSIQAPGANTIDPYSHGMHGDGYHRGRRINSYGQPQQQPYPNSDGQYHQSKGYHSMGRRY